MASYDWLLFTMMLKEEWRLHKSFIGGIGSGLFPAMIFLFSAGAAFTTQIFKTNISQSTPMLILHSLLLFYGFFVGGLGQVGEEAMRRRLGQLNVLLQLPRLLPVSLRKVMAMFFIKDAVYYIFYTLIPMIVGLGLGIFNSGIGISYITAFGLTSTLTFIYGMSLSFLLSSIYSKSLKLTATIIAILIGTIILVTPLNILKLNQLLLPLGFWETGNPLYLVGTLIASIILFIAALFTFQEKVATPSGVYPPSYMQNLNVFGFAGSLSKLVSKEWLEIRRSGALAPMLFGFVGPLIVIYGMTWVLQNGLGIPLRFNTIFYGGFIGFMGVMTYSWITNLEPNDFFNFQPVGIHDVISAKLVLYFVLVVPITVTYVLLIGLVTNELYLILPALIFSLLNTLYVASVTTYLTGLWTNTMLFGAKTLSQFTGLTLFPLISGVLTSFWVYDGTMKGYYTLAIICGGMLVLSILMLRSLEKKWRTRTFSFTMQ